MPDRSLTRTTRFSPVAVSRAASRQLAALDQDVLLARATIAAETRIAKAEIEALVDVTESAMFGASVLGSVGGCLLTGMAWVDRPMISIAETGLAGLRQIVHRQAQGDR